MAVTNRGSILISTANDIGSSLVDVIGGEGYTPNEWSKEINLCGIAAADVPTALENIEESTPSGTDRGSISLDTANAVGAVLNKKFNTARGFKPSEWASAISKLTELEVKTASGSVASFDDGADDVPLKSCTCEIVPQQDLHGYAKPWAPGAGVNKMYLPVDLDTTVDGLRVQYSKDSELFTISGNNTNSTSHLLKRWYVSNNEVKLPNFTVGETYTLFCDNTSLPLYMQFTYKDTNNATRALGYMQFSTGKVTFTIPSDLNTLVEFQLYCNGAATSVNGNFHVWVESGSISSSTYSPYSNICPITGTTEIEVTHTDGQNPPIESETRSVELDTPIYSGSAEILGGNGLANGRKKIKDFGTWIYVASYTGYFQIESRDMKAPVDNYTPLSGLYCEAYKTGTATEAGSGNINGTIAAVISGNSIFLRIKNNNYSDVNDFIRDFGDYYVVYPLATPDPFTFDPAPEISSYLGDNNISSDVQGGNTTVEYRADIDLAAT